MSGNNTTVWRTTDASSEWTGFFLEVQLPNVAEAITVMIYPYAISDSKAGPLPPADLDRELQRISVRNLAMTPGRVMGLGSDKIDFDALDPSKNHLPNISSLMRQGSYGYLQTLSPAVSPIIWTTIATGQGAKKHGITTFSMPAPGGDGKKSLASSSMRKVPAIWNIVTDYGEATVGSVGWWATWPAETVEGFIVSDKAYVAALKKFKDKGWVSRDKKAGDGDRQYYTYPAGLLERLRPQFAGPGDMSRAELENFLPELDDATWEQFKAIDRVIDEQRLSRLKFNYARDLFLHRSALSTFKEKRPDLLMVYYRGVDAIEHRFWHWEDPIIFPNVDKEKAGMFGRSLEGYYRFVDRMIGELVEAAGPEATIIIVSDHGHYPVDFMMERERGPTGGHRWQCPGVFVAAGPAIRKGHLTSTARIFDITPTALYLMGYPLAEDLEGRILTDVLDPEWMNSHQPESIQSYKYLSPHAPSKGPVSTEFDEQIKERLRALGYIVD